MNELKATRTKLRCLEMVKGTKLKWWEVVRMKGYKGYSAFDYEPDFGAKKTCYELAIGIVEGAPVFVSDSPTLYFKGNPFVITDVGYLIEGKSADWSWNPPKPKTVMVELTLEDVKYYANEVDIDIQKIIAMIDRRKEACCKVLEAMK